MEFQHIYIQQLLHHIPVDQAAAKGLLSGLKKKKTAKAKAKGRAKPAADGEKAG